jgi:hypothetical protein
LAGFVRKDRFESAFLTLMFGLLTALGFLFPRSGDDWAWGSSLGTGRLRQHFTHSNGRYAGDLLIVGLTRLTWLAPFAMAAVFALSLFLILDLTSNRTRVGYLVTGLLFLGMPLAMWREAVVWLSGATNYAIAGLCVLVYLRSVQREWLGTSPPQAGWAALVGIACFGFLAALFVEHVTFFFVVASVTVLVCFRYRSGEFSARTIAWAASFLLGAAAMFSSPAYRTAVGGGNGEVRPAGHITMFSLVYSLTGLVSGVIGGLFGPSS